jgi:hypothetical protein
MCGRPLRRKGDLTFGAAVGCGHVSGLFARHPRPLALMQSAAQLPISLSRSRRLKPNGFCRAPGSTGTPSRHHRPHAPTGRGDLRRETVKAYAPAGCGDPCRGR